MEEKKTQLICKIALLLLAGLVLYCFVWYVYTQRARHSNVKNDAINQLASYIQMKENEEEEEEEKHERSNNDDGDDDDSDIFIMYTNCYAHSH